MKLKMKDGSIVDVADADAKKLITAGEAVEVKPEPEVVKVESSEDIKKLLEKVRKEEKDKLYPQVEHYKKQSDTLQQSNELLSAKLKELEEAGKKVKEEKLSDSEKIQNQLSELTKQNVMLQRQQEALIEESRRAIEVERLGSYRTRAIAGAGGEIIPELVFGNSEAEIDTAILASKNAYRSIKEDAIKALKGTKAQAPIPGVQGAPSGSAENNNPSPQQMNVEALREMDPKDWAKNRLAIRKDVEAQAKAFFKAQ